MATPKDFLETKVTPVMEPLMIELLRNKPSDPVGYMIKYLAKLLEKPAQKPHDKVRLLLLFLLPVLSDSKNCCTGGARF